MPVTGISSNYPLSNPSYYGDDQIYFSDNGLWGSDTNPPYHFTEGFDAFQATRQQANAKSAPVYSLNNDGTNYGIAITGIIDLNGDTLPVRLETNVNYEKPEIKDKSNTRPTPIPLFLKITISNLEPGIPYKLYRYNDLASVPNSNFNSQPAYQSWDIQMTRALPIRQPNRSIPMRSPSIAA